MAAGPDVRPQTSERGERAHGWTPGQVVFDAAGVVASTRRVREPVHVVQSSLPDGGRLIGTLPATYPSRTWNRSIAWD
jgi:hypothetical protein